MKEPRVSVIMALFNCEKYARQAMESLLGQSFNDFELIIVDDASTDASLETIRSLTDARIRLLKNGTNRGAAYSRNRGLQEARGEYVAILDADDIAHQDRLREQVLFLDAHSDVCLVGSSYDIIAEDGTLENRCQSPAAPLTIRWKLLFGNIFAHSTVTYRREAALAAGGYDETMVPAEDYDLYVKMAARGKLAKLDQVLVEWRRNPHGLSSSIADERQTKTRLSIIRKSFELHTRQTISEEVGRVLMREAPPTAAPNKESLAAAYATIAGSLDYYLTSLPVTKSERPRLVQLALEDLFRVAGNNPGSIREVFQRAFRLCAKYKCWPIFNKQNITIVGMAVLPNRFVARLRRIKRSVVSRPWVSPASS